MTQVRLPLVLWCSCRVVVTCTSASQQWEQLSGQLDAESGSRLQLHDTTLLNLKSSKYSIGRKMQLLSSPIQVLNMHEALYTALQVMHQLEV